jgi:hypothetical protein
VSRLCFRREIDPCAGPGADSKVALQPRAPRRQMQLPMTPFSEHPDAIEPRAALKELSFGIVQHAPDDRQMNRLTETTALLLGPSGVIAARTGAARRLGRPSAPARSSGPLRGVRSWRIVGHGSCRRGRQLDRQWIPDRVGGGVRVLPAGRIERRSAPRLRPNIVAGSIAVRQVSWRWAVANVFNSPRLDSRRLSPSGATPAKGAPAEAPRPQNCFCETVSAAKRSVKVLAKTTGRDN